MAVKVRVQVGKAWLEVDASSPKDAMKRLSGYYEVFGELVCGQCKSDRLALGHREHDDHDYYQQSCLDCGARLDFGQHKNGETVFAKRKLPSGEYDREHYGWYHWRDRQGTTNPETGEF